MRFFLCHSISLDALKVDDKAVQSPFEGGRHLKISFPEASREHPKPYFPLLLSIRMSRLCVHQCDQEGCPNLHRVRPSCICLSCCPAEGIVLLRRHQESCPNRIVWVLRESEPERWISNGGDFVAYLKPPGVDDIISKVALSAVKARHSRLFAHHLGIGSY
jgi:hypothetical protein